MREYFRVFIACAVIFLAFTNSYDFVCNSDAEEDVFSGKGLVRYLIEVDMDWSAVSHPEDFPAAGSFSEFVGTYHKEDETFWDEGAMATEGFKTYIETGSTGALEHEIREIVRSKQAFELMIGDAVPTVDGRMKVIAESNIRYDHLSFVIKINPSPDWFIGVSNLPLKVWHEESYAYVWQNQITLDLYAIDGGTDDGVTFTSLDVPSAPPVAITTVAPPSAFPFWNATDSRVNRIGFVRLTKL